VTVAVYLQVDRFFPPEVNQRIAINQWLADNSIAHSSVQWFVDREEKTEFQQLSKDINNGTIKAVVLYSLEQAFTSIKSITAAFAEFDFKNVAFTSVSQGISFDKESVKSAHALLVIVLTLADTHKRTRQRIGIEKAQAKGLYKGKKPGSVKPKFDPKKIPRWKARGKSAKWIANKLKCAESTVFRYMRMYRQK
jgi:DNA invertase Pin-like site-specific DNA recombinase